MALKGADFQFRAMPMMASWRLESLYLKPAVRAVSGI